MTDLHARVFEGTTDAELVLLALALNSGAAIAGTPDTVGQAEQLNARLFELTSAEMQRREVDPNRAGRAIVERVVQRIVELAPEFQAPGG